MPEIQFERGEFQKTSLVDMRLELPLGIHPWEHDPRRPQLIRLDVDLYWTLPDGFRPVGIEDVVDYESLRADILAWSRHDHTRLMETLIEELVAIGFRDSRVEVVRIRMAKIGVFNDVAEAAVETVRRRNRP